MPHKRPPIPKFIAPEKLIDLRRRMNIHASKYGNPRSEDIASEYVCRLLEGYHAKATVGQAYIDICRLTSGRKGHPGYDAHRFLQMTVSSNEMQYVMDEQVSISDQVSIDDLIDLNRILSRITDKRLRDVFKMRVEGWTLQEIAVHIGVTEAYISKMILVELERLKQNL